MLALINAAGNGHSEVVKLLLVDERVDTNTADESGSTGNCGHDNYLTSVSTDEGCSKGTL